jgi:hypothetical protein
VLSTLIQLVQNDGNAFQARDSSRPTRVAVCPTIDQYAPQASMECALKVTAFAVPDMERFGGFQIVPLQGCRENLLSGLGMADTAREENVLEPMSDAKPLEKSYQAGVKV